MISLNFFDIIILFQTYVSFLAKVVPRLIGIFLELPTWEFLQAYVLLKP